MKQTLRIGLIGLDTSHVVAFTRLLNVADAEHHVAGGTVVAAYAGGTPGWDKSWSRVEGFTEKVRDQYGVTMADSPEAVAEAADLVFITAVDGRAHRDLFEKVAGQRKPTFIDKPFAASVADARAMLERAEAEGIPLMSCSSLRYAEAFTQALRDDAKGAIKGIDVFGPMALDEALPGLFWYGCHSVEMVVAAVGVGCRDIRAAVNEGVDVYTLVWDDGRVATIRGTRDGHSQFGATLHREQGFQQVDIQSGKVPYYASLLEAILRSLPDGRSDVPPEQMLEVVKIMEEGNRQRNAKG